MRMLMEGKAHRANGPNSPYPHLRLFDEPVRTELLYESYCSYAGSGYRERKEGFGIKLKKIFPSIVNKKVTDDGEDRSRHYAFPSLEKARREFEEHFGVKINWDNM